MFPILEIESRFCQYMKREMDIFGLEQVARLTEQWLLSFEGERDPAMSAIQNLCQQSSVEYDKRMLFSLSLALCFPTENTAQLFSTYRRYISQELPNIQQWVTAMDMVLESDDEVIYVDVVKGLRDVSPEIIETACGAYGVDRTDLILDAIAWDDLELLNLAIPDDKDKARHWCLSALAKFDPAPNSRIHKVLITTDQDERDFFFYRALEVRALLFDEYSGAACYKRSTGNRKPTLFPDGIGELELGDAAGPEAFYRQPDFQEKLMKEPDRIIKSFFQHLNNTGSYNDRHAAEITQAFLAAGIAPAHIVEHGPCAPKMVQDGRTEEEMSLKKALSRFEDMEPTGQAFYASLYVQYLKDFTTEQIIKLCDTPERLALAYRLTGKKAFLEAGNETTRSIVMSQDLGL